MGVSTLLGDFGETQGKILATSLFVTGAAALGLVTTGARTHGRLWVIPITGIVSSVAGFTFLIAAVWETSGIDWLWRFGVSLVIVATAVALVSLLSGVVLADKYRPIRRAAYLLAFICASILIAAVWDRPAREWGRILGIAFVLLAAATAAVPILARAVDDSPAEALRHCPFCGESAAGRLSQTITCPACGRLFRVVER